jgi:serine protease Do
MNRWLYLFAILACSASESQCETPAEFAAVINHAQQRMVKVYGGAIGRSPGYASGMIVSSEGDILTSYGVHLTTDAIRVTLPSGEQHFARLVRSDTSLQAALLKIDHKTPDFFQLEDESATVEGGDWVLALSNAFKVADGNEPLSVNLGVFTTRTKLDARRGAQDFPYTGEVMLYDAITSNPGAAGGAVVTAEGKLLGMIGRVIEGKHSGTRLNYAFPVDVLRDFVLHPEKMKMPPAETPLASSSNGPPGDVGIRLFALGGRKAPAFVDRVIADSPAGVAGIKTDDLVITLDGKPVKNAEDFQKIMGTITVGQQITVEVKRKNNVLAFPLVAVGKQP